MQVVDAEDCNPAYLKDIILGSLLQNILICLSIDLLVINCLLILIV